MAILKSGTGNNGTPIVASASADYGLYVGPKGGFSKAGIQVKAPKWANLFTLDESGTPNLMNVLEYLNDTHSDFVGVIRGVEDFIDAYTAWKAEQERDAA